MNERYMRWIAAVLASELAGKPHHEAILAVCATPALLVTHGCAPLPIVLKAKTVGKIFFDHGMTQRQIEQLPALINGPKALYKSATHTESVVVLTFEMNLGAPVIVPIAMNRLIGRSRVNEITSAYAKTGPDATVRWREQGLLLWEKAP